MVTDAFSKMAQPGFLMEVGNVLGGYTAAEAVDYSLDRVSQRDIPDEVGGVGAIAALEVAPVVSGQQMRKMQIGAGVNTGMALADRLGIKDAITGAL